MLYSELVRALLLNGLVDQWRGACSSASLRAWDRLGMMDVLRWLGGVAGEMSWSSQFHLYAYMVLRISNNCDWQTKNLGVGRQQQGLPSSGGEATTPPRQQQANNLAYLGVKRVGQHCYGNIGSIGRTSYLFAVSNTHGWANYRQSRQVGRNFWELNR